MSLSNSHHRFSEIYLQQLTLAIKVTFYKKCRIPKGKSGFRTIYTVDPETKQRLRSRLPYLEQRLSVLDKVNANYAFTKGKNCVLNSLQHVGYKYTLSLDLENFFDNVTAKHVEKLLRKDVIDDCFIDGAPRQGLPTSPLIATIAFLKCDQEIRNVLDKVVLDCVYTRYADDLIISFNNRKDVGRIKFLISKIVEKYNFKLNKKKTKLQCVDNGRIIINGIAVDLNGLYPTRKTKKKIRAALHQGCKASARGLIEWARCKLPNNYAK